MKTICISESTSDDLNGCSAQDLASVDQAASMKALDDQTLEAVERAYPGDDVSLTEGSTRAVGEDGMEDPDITEAVLDIVSKVYESWAWLRNRQGQPLDS